MNNTTNNTDVTSTGMPQWLQAFCTNSKWDLKQLSHLSLTGATPCFESMVIYGIVGITSIILAIWRIHLLRTKGYRVQAIPDVLFYSKLIISILTTLIPLFLINVLVAQNAFAPYEIVSHALMFLSFLLITIIILMEREKHLIASEYVYRFLVLWNCVAIGVQIRSFIILGNQTNRHEYYITMSIFEVICLAVQVLIAYFFSETFRIRQLDKPGEVKNVNESGNNSINMDTVAIGLKEIVGGQKEDNYDVQGKLKKDLSLEEKASLCSKLFFGWLSPMIKIGYTRPLELGDIPMLHTGNKAEHATNLVEHAWNKALSDASLAPNSDDDDVSLPKTVSLLRVIGQVCWYPYLKIVPVTILAVICQFVAPLLLQSLIRFIGSDRPDSEGYFYIGLIFVFNVFSIVCEAYATNQLTHLALKIKSGLIGMIYRKSLRLSLRSQLRNSSGKTVNLISSDVNGIVGAVHMFNALWMSPLQIIIAMTMLYTAVGAASLAGLGAVVLASPLMLICFAYLASGMQKMLKFTDSRVKMVSEALSSMRVIKYYGWESKFLENIVNERNKEMHVASWLANTKATMLMLFNLNPVLLQVAMFCVYAAINPTGLQGTEGASRAFFALSLCQMVLMPLLMLPNSISAFIQAGVRANRLKEFLLLDQVDPATRTPLKQNQQQQEHVGEKKEEKTYEGEISLKLKKSSYSWDENAPVHTLSNVEMDVQQGAICCK
jgi:hypothetical protein